MGKLPHFASLLYACITVGVCLARTSFVTPQTPIRRHHSPVSRVAPLGRIPADASAPDFPRSKRQIAEDNEYLNYTYKLLKRGDDEITLRNDGRDLTLVVGLTGVGKTTITLLLSGNNSAMSAVEVDGYTKLIVDEAGLISSPENTIVSKTIFPALVVDRDTGDLLYDYPGVDDTRNASIEIANTVFMKKVADHGNKIRLLLIADHNSVTLGKDRKHYAKLVEYLLGFVRNLKIFKNSIAMIVSKCETDKNKSSEIIIKSVAKFINLSQEIWEGPTASDLFKSKQEEIKALTESLLQTDSAGMYTNIGVFRTPEGLGKLSDMRDVQTNRLALRQIVFHNPNFQYQPKQKGDFGNYLSAEARLVAQSMVQKLLFKVAAQLEKLEGSMTDSYVTKIEGIQFFGEKIAQVSNDIESLDLALKELPQGCAVSISNASVEVFVGLTNKMRIDLDVEVVDFFKKESDHIEFLEDAAGMICKGSGRESVKDKVADVLKKLKISVESFTTWFDEVQKQVTAFTTEPRSPEFIKKVIDLKLGNEKLTKDNVHNLKLMTIDHMNQVLYKNNPGEQQKLNLLQNLLSLLSLNDEQCDYNSGNKTLWVRGHILSASQVKICTDKHENKGIQNLVIFSTWVFHLDADINGTRIVPYDGLNLFLIAPIVNIPASGSIILSGKDGIDYDPPVAAKGNLGQPGRPGGNGGHFFGAVGKVQGAGDITIKANGGRGGRGQKGGEGKDGVSADRVTLNDIECIAEKNISVTKTNFTFKEVSSEKTHKCETDYPNCTIFEIHSPPPPSNDVRKSIGMDGGAGGLGGIPGKIDRNLPQSNGKVKIITEQGDEGEGGEGGEPGKSGEPAVTLIIRRRHRHISDDGVTVGSAVGTSVGIIVSLTIFWGGVRAVGGFAVSEPLEKPGFKVYAKAAGSFCGTVGSIVGSLIAVGVGAVGGYFLGTYIAIWMMSPGKIDIMETIPVQPVVVLGDRGVKGTNSEGRGGPSDPQIVTHFFDYLVKQFIVYALDYVRDPFLQPSLASFVNNTLLKLPA